MTEKEAMEALGRGATVLFRTISRIYKGKLIARIGPDFIFEGTDGKETIKFRGNSQFFSLEGE